MAKTTPPIRFAGAELSEWRHVCAFFNSRDEEYRVLIPFIRDGLERGEKAVHIVNPRDHEDHRRRLLTAGIGLDRAEQTSQFELRSDTATYLRDGRFDASRMFEAFEQMTADNADEGFALARIVCHMEWAAEDGTHLDALVEFESRVNELWRRREDAVICTYDLAKFGGETVIDILRTHPMVIVGGILQRNPFFVPPEEFLIELRERRA
jgi:MEDS: MEthanogen/methylotroph, DcmR Sensory domain